MIYHLLHDSEYGIYFFEALFINFLKLKRS